MNKFDLRTSYNKEENFFDLETFETSAKTGKNVKEVFLCLNNLIQKPSSLTRMAQISVHSEQNQPTNTFIIEKNESPDHRLIRSELKEH
jgi:hypothetical protein